ncbi:hypothetical protein L4174_009365 [Photobacterium sp. CCB-ST2H9]|uniref:hypothetical protein n=1 Tax=Photobacterium sp. CCB-ST2H9 TaxID=2912855 RepID=UPI00200381A3|nr:hypothetical protein [Photobacterium sp. CCB-ST2H9]UTM56061.1 hypothetical protein L4174_009365 [Photobacterium sp. CCB-ST2H9]
MNEKYSYDLGCEQINVDAHYDALNALKKVFIISTGAIPEVGKPLSEIINIIWPKSNPDYSNLYNLFLCRAKNYIEKDILDHICQSLDNKINMYEEKFKSIDALIADGNIQEAYVRYKDISMEMVGVAEEFSFENDIRSAAYTAGFYSTWISMVASYWINQKYTETLSLEESFLRGQLTNLQSLLINANEYCLFIEENMHSIFSTINDINEFQQLRMWVSLNLREVVNQIAYALNGNFSDFYGHDYSVDVANFPVAYVHDLVSGRSAIQGSLESYYVDSLLAPNSEIHKTLCVNKGSMNTPVSNIDYIRWQMMHDFDNPAVYNLFWVNTEQATTGYPGEAEAGKPTNGSGNISPLYIKEIRVHKGMTLDGESQNILFVLSNDQIIRTHDDYGSLVCSYKREGYAIVGMAAYRSLTQTAIESFAFTFLKVGEDAPTLMMNENNNPNCVTLYEGKDYTGKSLQLDASETLHWTNLNFNCGSMKSVCTDYPRTDFYLHESSGAGGSGQIEVNTEIPDFIAYLQSPWGWNWESIEDAVIDEVIFKK